MSKLEIAHKTWILIGDGQKALFLENEGDELAPNFKRVKLFAHDNPPTREQGTDKPGRYHDGPSQARSAVGQTDWHQLEEDRFAHEIAQALRKEVEKGSFEKLVLVAPPRVLGELRKSLHSTVTDRIIGELDKTLTNHPIGDIEKLLTNS